MTAPEFGDLRSLMNEPRSPRVWEQVCAWAEAFDDETWTHRALPYLEGHLAAWPSQERMVPRRWIQAMLAGEKAPRMALARHLDASQWGKDRRRRREVLAFFALLSHSELSHIWHLNLSYNVLDDTALQAFHTSPYADGVRDLDLSAMFPDERAAPALFTTQAWPGVTSLRLRENALEDDHLEALASGGAFSRAPDALDLFGNHVTARGLRALADSVSWRGIETLDLGRNQLGGAGIDALAFPNLRVLRLERCDLGDAEIERLAQSPHLHGLRELKLWGNHVSDDGVQALAMSPGLSGLEVLNLGRNDISDQGARALAESPHLTSLRELNLYGNRIGSSGAQALAASSNVATLISLRLGDNEISALGQDALEHSVHLSSSLKGFFGV